MSDIALSPIESAAFRTAPSQTETAVPRGVPYIIGNEAAERFSFYGMKSILTLFMVRYLLTRAGQPDPMSENDAEKYSHYFNTGVYYLPIVGALISDGIWGKYRTILWLSIVYCFGHFALAINDTRFGLTLGLALICVGAGGIKPCVSANVGDQFGAGNKHLLSKVFGWFYFSINAGSFISTLLCPFLLEYPRYNITDTSDVPILSTAVGAARSLPLFGPHWAFGIPGVAMVVATLFFWLGRRKYVHVPPAGLGFVRTALGPEGAGIFSVIFRPLLRLMGTRAQQEKSGQPTDPPTGNGLRGLYQTYGIGVLGRIAIIYLFIIIFWALWNQSSGTEWTLQADKMDLHFLGLTLSAGQVQTANAILILVYIPLVNYILYPAISKVFPLTPLRKIGIGLFLMVGSAVVIVHIQRLIDAGQHPTVWWQMLAYVILTLSEAMVSITGLEFSYTQSPTSMKSAVMAMWLFSAGTGSLLLAWFHGWNHLDNGKTKITDLQFFQGCAWVMLAASCLFVVVARFYRGRTYLQGIETKAEADIGVATANMPA